MLRAFRSLRAFHGTFRPHGVGAAVGSPWTRVTVRHVKPGLEPKVEGLLEDTHVVLAGQPGLCGAAEMLQDYDNPRRCMVVTRWRTREAMQAWVDSPERAALRDAMEPALVRAPATVVLHPLRPDVFLL